MSTDFTTNLLEIISFETLTIQLISAELHCRPSIDADCDFTEGKAKVFLAGKKPKVYLAFDDGPGYGTSSLLDALKNNSVKVMH